jgi:molybdate-binding protein/DNA-binding XRE family transcriptional regulator
MTAAGMPEIENNLGELRRRRGLSAIELAGMAGVTRQTIYAIEAGSYVPNTTVALRLARALGTGIEELFRLPEDTQAPDLRSEQAMLLPGSEALRAGQPVQLCPVDKKLMAAAPSPLPWYFPASDAVVAADKPSGAGKTRVQAFRASEEFRNRILVAGCDPGISVLARHVQAAGAELVLAHRNSSQALALLHDGCVHVAGTHLRDEASGESNIPEIGRLFRRKSVAVISFAIWEEGILMARSNPRSIRGIEDFARHDVSIVNREKGSGSRMLLDTHLRRLNIDARTIRGYGVTTPGHLAAAWQVQSGTADCCIATRAAARIFGLGFIPLVSERYDLAIRRQHLDLPGIQILLDALSRSGFRRELESLGGYDAKAAGQRML